MLYLAVICTLVLVGVIFHAMVLCALINILTRVRGDVEYITEILNKDYAKKVADLMLKNGFVAKKINMTEEEAKNMAREFYSKEK